jgi:hypothetical protein
MKAAFGKALVAVIRPIAPFSIPIPDVRQVERT